MKSIAAKYLFIYIGAVLLPILLVAAYAIQFTGDSHERGRREASQRLLAAYRHQTLRALHDVDVAAATLRESLVSKSGERFVARTVAGKSTDEEWRRWMASVPGAALLDSVVVVDPVAGVIVGAADSARTLNEAEKRSWTVRTARGRWRDIAGGIVRIGLSLPGGRGGGERALLVDVPVDSLAARAEEELGDQPSLAFFLVDVENQRIVHHVDPALKGAPASALADRPTRALPGRAFAVGVDDRSTSTAAANARNTIALVALLAAIGAALLFLIHARAVRTDLRAISGAARRYGRGQLDHRIATWRDDEIGEAARELNAMAERLDRSTDSREIEARYDLLARLRHRVSHELADVRKGMSALADNLESPTTPRVILRGAGRVLRRLEAMLERTEAATLSGQTHEITATTNGRPLELRPLLESCADEVRDRVGDEIRLQLEVPSRVPPTTVGESTLKGVLRGVLDNAVRAMPEGGTLKVEVVPETTRLSVNVIDTGHGIPGSFLRRRLFQPFASAWEDKEGFGMALHRSREVLRQLGGDIDVSSRETVGTRVSLRLPIRPD